MKKVFTCKNQKPSLHHSAVCKSIDFIDKHLEEELSLEKVAAFACYSPYHFHRIFSSIAGETLNGYITRKRIEKAAAILMHRPDTSIQELAMQYGFTSNSAFTRTFRKFYGLSPQAFRKNYPGKHSRIVRSKSKNGQVSMEFVKDLCTGDQQKQWIEFNAVIEVRVSPSMEAIALNHIGVHGLEQTFDRLIHWVRKKQSYRGNIKLMRMFHDSLRITDPAKVRMSACLLLDKAIEPDGEMQRRVIPEGKFIVGHYEIDMTDYPRAWAGLFTWMNENGFKHTGAECFEIIHNDFRKHAEKKVITDLYIPVMKR